MNIAIVLVVSGLIGIKHLRAGFFAGLLHAAALMLYSIVALAIAYADDEAVHRAPLLVAPIPNLWLWMAVGWLVSGSIAASRSQRRRF